MRRSFRPTFAEHHMLFSILLSSDALYIFSLNQPQHTCGQKTPTHEQISVVTESWLGRPGRGVREVIGSIPVGFPDFALSHARDKVNIPSF